VLTYLRHPVPVSHTTRGGNVRMRIAKRVFAHLPDGILAMAGKVLYKHIG
jgi:hypothetical protein